MVGKLCPGRAKSGETLMEAHSDTGDELYAYDILFVLGKLMEEMVAILWCHLRLGRQTFSGGT